MIRLAVATGLQIAALASAAAVAAPAHGRSALQRDIESYATAACLSRQREPLLKEQGDAWASAIIQRSHGSIDHFTTVAKAVDGELKRRPVAVGHDEATGKDKSLPALLCGEIGDSPLVRAAMVRAEAQLSRDYGPGVRRD